ncbi:hypothetical protein H8L32_17585 [Undibacterium sp. CY18W]|uniref:Uncharacterized protein n=1 Tax=Undibacterium hunanense TaxID=2762292 RepID=A0ABR6ZTT8_9BURK|nr:hypothetical protein [Undibacterium hunanense]MBC3919306.1 hypothetical protein [Undibacterium hunanense]
MPTSPQLAKIAACIYGLPDARRQKAESQKLNVNMQHPWMLTHEWQDQIKEQVSPYSPDMGYARRHWAMHGFRLGWFQIAATQLERLGFCIGGGLKGQRHGNNDISFHYHNNVNSCLRIVMRTIII